MLHKFFAEEDGITLLGTIVWVFSVPVVCVCAFLLYVHFLHQDFAANNQVTSSAVAVATGGK